MIVLFRGNRLVTQLKNNSVPEFHKLIYLALPIICGYLMDLFLPKPTATLDTGPLSLKLVIYAIGIGAIYYVNKSGDNKKFLERFICLSFPAAVIVNTLGFLYGFFRVPFMMQLLGREMLSSINPLFFTINFALNFILVGYWMNCLAKQVSNK